MGKLLGLIAVALCLGLPGAADSSAVQDTGCTVHVLEVEKRQIRSQGAEIRFDLPVLCHPKADRQVRQWAERQMAAFMKEAAKAADVSPFLEGEADFQSHRYFLSVQFQVASYLGGAHPNTYIQTFVFDMRSGQKLDLDSIFHVSAAFLDLLSQTSIRQLEADRQRPLTPVEKGGLAPADQPFSSFSLLPQGLRCHFQLYQTGARAEGFPRIDIPWQQVKRWIRPGYEILGE